jgi:hypothetical protein
MLILLPYLFSPPGDENQSVASMDQSGSGRANTPSPEYASPAFRHSTSSATAQTYLTHPNVSLSSSSSESALQDDSDSEDEDDAWPQEDVDSMFLHGIRLQTMTYESTGPLRMQMTWDEEEEEVRGAVLRSSSLVREPFRDISNRTSPRNIIFRAH